MESPKEEHYLLDYNGLREVTKTFIKTGLKKKSLVYIHGMRDYRGVICHTYRIVE